MVSQSDEGFRLCWVPSRIAIGIVGNEAADDAARDVIAGSNTTKKRIPIDDYECFIGKKLNLKW